jgi:hypothetical protein
LNQIAYPHGLHGGASVSNDGNDWPARDEIDKRVHKIAPWPENNRWAEDDVLEAAGANELFRLPLGLVVAASGFGPGAEAAHVEEPLYPGACGGGKQVSGSLHVYALERGTRGFPDDAHKVNNRVHAGQRFC